MRGVLRPRAKKAEIGAWRRSLKQSLRGRISLLDLGMRLWEGVRSVATPLGDYIRTTSLSAAEACHARGPFFPYRWKSLQRWAAKVLRAGGSLLKPTPRGTAW